MKTILAALNSKFIHSNLAIRYLKGYCPDFQVELFEASINENLLEVAVNITDMKPDVIGFSCYIWNIEETLKLCSTLKKINEKLIIILGGPEVTYDSEKVLEDNSFIDFIVKSEGEQVFRNLLGAIECSGDLKKIKGIVYRNDCMIISNENESLIQNLDIIPFPYTDGLPDKIVYYESSRGCPFSCSYCLSSTIRGVRYFSIERVKKDLKYFIDNDVKLVKFVDRTFNANRGFALDIWKFLIENRKNTRFHFEIAADLIDKEMIKVLMTAPKDLFQFEIGVQTTNTVILENINRIMNFDVIGNNIKLIRENCSIPCHLDLIAGLPGENMDSFINSFNMCMTLKPDVLQLGFLKVLKGTPVRLEAERYGIRYIDYPPYQVLYTNDLGFMQMKELLEFEKVFETFYNSGIFGITIDYLLSNSEDAFTFFNGLYDHAKKDGFFLRSYNLMDKFKLLYDFAEKMCDKEILKDLIIHDLIINTKKAYLPDFLAKNLDSQFKNTINASREVILKRFNLKDTKSIFAIPVNVQVKHIEGEKKYENIKSIIIFNLHGGEYFYL